MIREPSGRATDADGCAGIRFRLDTVYAAWMPTIGYGRAAPSHPERPVRWL